MRSAVPSHIPPSTQQIHTIASRQKSLATWPRNKSKIEGSPAPCFPVRKIMASFLDGIGNVFGFFFGSGDSEDDYLSPPEYGGKRKAREELKHPSQSYKARRYSASHAYVNRSAYNRESSEESDLSEGPQYLARGTQSEIDTDQSSLAEYNPESFLKHRNSLEKHRARAQAQRRRSSTHRDSVHDSVATSQRWRSSSARRVSTERVREQRLNFFGQIGNGLANVARNVVSTIAGTEAGEPDESSDFERPELTEKNIQKQLIRDRAAEDEDSDAQLSEGALGRKYWSTTLLKSQRPKLSAPVGPARFNTELPLSGSSKDVEPLANKTMHENPKPM